LLEALNEQGQTFLADAVEHAQVDEQPGEVRFIAPREFSLSLKSAELKVAVAKVIGRPVKTTLVVGDAAAAPKPPAASLESDEDELTQRAMAHPEVQRFQEMFPGSHVRAVRNLKQ
jgi:DNA polymerase-3 subunit gamma/tau